MKLRIHGNSLRLRLGRSEVEQLAHQGEVRAALRFSPQSDLTYSLVTSPAEPNLSARLIDGGIQVTVAPRLAREWAASEQVGLHHTQPIDGEDTLSILVEKDFRCLDPRPGEDQSDSFLNPLEEKQRC